jgi:hypothetical protein
MSGVCLFCGKKLKTDYDEYTAYQYCECEDSVAYEVFQDAVHCLKEEYILKLRELKKEKPRKKFFERNGVVYKIKARERIKK